MENDCLSLTFSMFRLEISKIRLEECVISKRDTVWISCNVTNEIINEKASCFGGKTPDWLIPA